MMCSFSCGEHEDALLYVIWGRSAVHGGRVLPQSTRSSVHVLGHPALCVGLIRAQAPAAHSLPCVAVPLTLDFCVPKPAPGTDEQFAERP